MDTEQNPFQPPEADLLLAEVTLLPARTVNAAQGGIWWQVALSMVWDRKGVWFGFILIWWLISAAVSLIPILGLYLQLFLWPLFIACHVHLCRAQESEHGASLSLWAKGLTQNSGQLGILGLGLMAYAWLTTAGAFWIAGGTLESLMVQIADRPAPNAVPAAGDLAAFAVAAGSAILLGLLLVIWCGSAAVAVSLHGQPIVQALSVLPVALMRNVSAFYVWCVWLLGILMLIAALFAVLIYGVNSVSQLLPSIGRVPVVVAAVLAVMPHSFWLVAVLGGSIYVSFCDVYEHRQVKPSSQTAA